MIPDELKSRMKRLKGGETDPLEIARTRDMLELRLFYIADFRPYIKFAEPHPTYDSAKDYIHEAISYCDSQLQKLGYVYDSHRGRLSRR